MKTLLIITLSTIAGLGMSAEIVSTFSTDTEGWSANGDPESPVRWNSSGGNPGGYASVADQAAGDTIYFIAPGKFLGDMSGAFGQTLSFDLRQQYSGAANQFNASDVILTGGGRTIVIDAGANPPNNVWTRYTVTLAPGFGWRVGGVEATEADIRAVLSQLTSLRIRAEYRSGDEVDSLDNVRLVTITCPPASIRCSEVEICWPSALNSHYRIDYRSSLPTDPWMPLVADIVGTGEEMCVYDRIVRGQPRRFYRIVCESEIVGP